MQNMTPEEQNRAIAEWCGRKWHKPTPEEIASGCYYQYAPDYTADLNMMHAAEMRLTAEDHGRFADILFEIAFALGQGAKPYISATAAHRAQALLRAIGKWRE